MLIPDSYDVKRSAVNEKWVRPLISHGMSCMSFGFVSPSAGVAGAGGREAAVMRGPMASKVTPQHRVSIFDVIFTEVAAAAVVVVRV